MTHTECCITVALTAADLSKLGDGHSFTIHTARDTDTHMGTREQAHGGLGHAHLAMARGSPCFLGVGVTGRSRW